MVARGYILLSLALSVCLTTYNFVEVKPVQFGPIPLTAGFVLITLSYIISDCITELYGFRAMRTVILTIFGLHVMMIAMVQLSCWMPPHHLWQDEAAYELILGQTPWIAVLSAVAFCIGSTINAWVMHRLKARWAARHFRIRAFLSTVAGEGADNIFFFTIAFSALLPGEEVCKVVLAQIGSKLFLEAMVLPITHRVVDYFKRSEQV